MRRGPGPSVDTGFECGASDASLALEEESSRGGCGGGTLGAEGAGRVAGAGLRDRLEMGVCGGRGAGTLRGDFEGVDTLDGRFVDGVDARSGDVTDTGGCASTSALSTLAYVDAGTLNGLWSSDDDGSEKNSNRDDPC